MRLIRISVLLLAGLSVAPGCAMPSGDTPAEERRYAEQVRHQALHEFYEKNPEVRRRADTAAGTFFLSGFSLHPGLLTFANGYGIVEDNTTGEQSHVRLFRLGVGPGLSIKGYYLLVIIDDPQVLEELANGTWAGGAFAEASLEFGDFGGTAAANGTFNSATHGHIWTHTGFALELTLAGAHIGSNEELNEDAASDAASDSYE